MTFIVLWIQFRMHVYIKRLVLFILLTSLLSHLLTVIRNIVFYINMIDVLFIISIILINDILVNMIVFITFIRRIIVPYF